jgi:hypothetical protein
MTRALALGLVWMTCGGAVLRAADVTDRLTRTLPLADGRAIRVDATVGDVTIVGSNRPDVLVEIVRRAPSAADLARFPVVVDDAGDALRIGAAQSNDGRDAALVSTITLRVPAAAIVQAVRLFEGHLRLSGLTRGCDADVRRGPIEASGLAGRIRLESGIGSVEVKDATLDADGMLRLRVFNGPVRVRFARRPANARILAVTLNGRIDSDIPLTMKDQFGPRFGETTLGSGEPVVSLDVVKGDIAITVGR